LGHVNINKKAALRGGFIFWHAFLVTVMRQRHSTKAASESNHPCPVVSLY